MLFNKLLDIFKNKKKVENPEIMQEYSNPGVQVKEKKKPKFIAIVIFISALGFSIGYVYFNLFATPGGKPLPTYPQVNENIFNDTNVGQNIPAQTQNNSLSQPSPSQTETTNKQTVQNNNEPNKKDLNATDIVTSNKLYIPAKDILLNTATAKQELENQIAILKSQVELKKLENELEKIQEDKKLIPFSAKVQLNKLTQEIAEKRVEPVKVPVIPPDLLGIYQIDDKKIGVFFLNGVQIKASEGEYVGEFIVQSMQNNQAIVKDSQGRTYNISMRLPDRYAVGQSMFKKGESVQTTRVISSPTGGSGAFLQPGQIPPPTYVPITSEMPPLNVYKGK